MILLDTCTLLWLVMEPKSLSKPATAALRKSKGAILVSAVTAFEIGQKYAVGKLILPFQPNEWFDRACLAHGLTALPLTSDHAFAAASLPLLHRDPFDRLLIATATHADVPLLTPDPLIRQYPTLATIW